MPSDYAAFDVVYEDTAGEILSVGAGIDVHIRAAGEVADEAESPLTTDVNGNIPSGTLAGVAVGTRVHFRVENFNGMAFSISQVTT